ncbi:MAG: helix-turn-helix domain-containing protein [Candidatus Micrarchaeota archaeon]
MWVAKIKMWHAGSASLDLTHKYKVTLTVHYLNAFQEKGTTWINRAIVIEGEEKEKALRAILREEKKRINVIETSNSQVIYSIKCKDQYHITIMGNRTFFVRPIVVRDGFEFWTVGSHDKKQIVELVKQLNCTGTSSAEMLSLRKGNPTFYAAAETGNLTEKQIDVFRLAHQEGYYEYPRKTDLNKLAKLAKLSKTALRACLRRAEGAMLKSAYNLYK